MNTGPTPSDPVVMDRLSQLGLLRWRGSRAGRQASRSIRVIHSSHVALNTCGPNSMVKPQCPMLCRNVNNLVYLTIARHAVQKMQSISCGLLNVRSARNKIDACAFNAF